MAIAIRASGSTTVESISANPSVAKPSGAVAGDVAVMSITFAWGSGGPMTSTTPTGWTALSGGTNIGGSGATSTQRTSVYYRVIQAGDTSWSLAFSGSVTSETELQCFSGCDTANPIDAVGTASTNSGASSITAGAVTVVTAGAWELIATGSYNGVGTTATGFTALTAPGAFSVGGTLLYNSTALSTGSTGTVAVSNSQSATGQTLAAIPFALRPDVPVVATAGVTLGAATASASCTWQNRAIAAPTLGGAAAAAIGTFRAVATAAPTLGAAPAVAPAFCGSFATAARTLGATTAAAVGTYRNVAIAAPTLGATTAAAAGTWQNRAIARPTLAAAAASAVGVYINTIAAHPTLGAAAGSGRGTLTTRATAAIAARPLLAWGGDSSLFYHVYISPSAGAAIDYDTPVATTTGRSWTSAALPAGTWQFGVRASTGALFELNLDCSATVVVDATGADISARPDPPSGLRAHAGAAGAIVVEWNAAAVTVAAKRPTGFHIYIGTGGTPNYATPAATAAYGSAIAGSYQRTLTGLTDGVAYAVGVRAYNATAEEPNLATATVTAVVAGPLPVSGLAGAAIV